MVLLRGFRRMEILLLFQPLGEFFYFNPPSSIEYVNKMSLYKLSIAPTNSIPHILRLNNHMTRSAENYISPVVLSRQNDLLSKHQLRLPNVMKSLNDDKCLVHS